MYLSKIIGLSNVDPLDAVSGRRKKDGQEQEHDFLMPSGDRVTISDAARQLMQMADAGSQNPEQDASKDEERENQTYEAFFKRNKSGASFEESAEESSVVSGTYAESSVFAGSFGGTLGSGFQAESLADESSEGANGGSVGGVGGTQDVAGRIKEIDGKIQQLQQQIVEVHSSGLPEGVKEARISALESQIGQLVQEKVELESQLEG